MSISKKEKTKRADLVFSIIILFLLFIIVFLLLNFFDFFSEKHTVKLYLEVVEGNFLGVGFDKDKTNILNFSSLSHGKSATMDIFLNNNETGDMKVKTKVKGNIKEFIHIEDEFNIKEFSEKKIGVTAVVNDSALFGSYEGEIEFIFN